MRVCFNYIDFSQESTQSRVLSWCLGDGETPLLIPNRAVKPISAEDTLLGKIGRRQDKVRDFILVVFAKIIQNKSRCDYLLLLVKNHPFNFNQQIFTTDIIVQ